MILSFFSGNGGSSKATFAKGKFSSLQARAGGSSSILNLFVGNGGSIVFSSPGDKAGATGTDGGGGKSAQESNLIPMVWFSLLMLKYAIPFHMLRDQTFFFYGKALGHDTSALLTEYILDRVIIPAMVRAVENKLKELTAKVEDISISFDEWSSSAKESYLSMTAHWVGTAYAV